MKNYLKLFLIFTLIFLLAVSCIANKKSSGAQLMPAPDFKLPDMEGNTVILSSYKDKQPVILFFWTTWCYFCRKELKIINDMCVQFKDEKIELLAVNVGESKTVVENFIKNRNLTFKVPLDQDLAVAADYDILGVPTYILVDKKGYMIFRGNYFPKKEYKDLK